MKRDRPPERPEPPEDVAFREAMRDVRPLARVHRVVHRWPRPAPVPLQRLRDEREVLAESLILDIEPDAGLVSGDELVFLRPGLSRQILRNLRRGHWIVQAHLDLHGHTAAEARAAVAEFLALCLQRGMRCLRIVHGKGLRSRNREPVLKKKVAGWLMQREEVLAYCEARPADGGSGAVMVLLRSPSRTRPRGG